MTLRTFGLTLAACVAAATPVWGDDAAGQGSTNATWRVQAGGGVLVTPDFQGSSSHRTRALPYISVDYGDLISASVAGGVSANLFREGDFVAGPIARFQFGQKEKDSPDLRGLGGVDPSVEVGGFVRYQRGPFSMRLTAGQDVIGGHRGTVSELGGSLTKAIAQTGAGPVFVSAGPSVTFVTARVNRAFFGIDRVQSAASGLPIYRPSGGVQQFGLNATVIAPLNRRLTVVGIAGYSRLLDAAADSPRVRLRGSPDQISGGVFLTYSF